VVVVVDKDDDDEADEVSVSALDTIKGRWYERPDLRFPCGVAKASAASRRKKP
jgi:hypothetical protein